MSNFNVTRLSGQRALVQDTSGTHQAILDTAQWDEIKHRLAHDDAEKDFGAAVEEFFKPLEEAINLAEEKLAATLPKTDPAFTVEIAPAHAVVPAAPVVTFGLVPAAAVLRFLESGDHSRLIWVGDTIEILAA
mgnify:CR=1 FL=1